MLQLAVDVAAALEHLHVKNVAHSDVTPNNILLKVGWLTILVVGLVGRAGGRAGGWLVRWLVQ